MTNQGKLLKFNKVQQIKTTTKGIKKIMSHPIYTNKFCSVGRKILVENVITSGKGHMSRKAFADAMNKALGLNEDNYLSMNEDSARSAVRCGAFDTKENSWWDYRGKFGGIRVALLADKPAEAKAKKEKAPKPAPEAPAEAEAETPSEQPAE